MRAIRKILLAGSVYFLFSLIIFGQNGPPPPPPPLIFSAPLPSEIKEVVSKEDSFSISFSGQPKVERVAITDLGKATFSMYRQGSLSRVEVYEYKSAIEASQQEAILDSFRREVSALQEKASYLPSGFERKIDSETEILMDGYKGKEFLYNISYEHHRTRVLFVKNRVFFIGINVTNWHIIFPKNKDVIGAFDKEADRFFNSFKILK